MTATRKITIAFAALLIAAGITAAPAWIGYQLSRAESADYVVTSAEKPVELAQTDTGSARLDAGMPSTPDAAPAATAETKPADKLHDPIDAPGAAWDDVKAAKKIGWPALVFAVTILLCKLLGRSKKYAFLAFLGKGKVPVVVGALNAIAISCYNAAADGGAWTAMAFAGLMGLSHYLDAGGKAES